MKHKKRSLNFVNSCLLMMGLVCFGTAFGLGFVVDDFGEGSDSDLNDNACSTAGGSCTLRAAIQQANFTSGLDIIEFQANGTVLLANVIIDITDSLTIRPGTATQITISSASQSRLLRVLQNGTTAVFEDLKFSNPAGGAIIVGLGPQVTIRRCVFDGNINSSGSASGGALSIGGETTIDSSEFRNNSSNLTSGGAIFLGTGALLTIRNSVIEDNSARTGGGIAVGGGLERLVLEDVTIQRNHASVNGGGIYSQSRVESEGVTLFQNTTNGNGGGIWAENRGGGNTIDALKLVGADIRDNTADLNGGGIYLDSGVALHTFLISRSAVWENDANLGGGVYVAGGTGTDIKVAN
ncbi:MAG: right-handed parallel beta-helix repeat-containing protein, partial [Lysobacterales bacterium]